METKKPEMYGAGTPPAGDAIRTGETEKDTSRRNDSSGVKNSAPRKRFPTPGDVFAMLGIVLGAQIVVGLVVGIVAVATYGFQAEWPDEPVLMGRMMAVSYLVTMTLALVGVLAYRRVRGGGGPVANFSRRRLNPVLLLWAFVLIAGVNVVLEPVVTLLPGPPYESMGRGIWTVLSLVVLAPLFEETICRGILIGSLRAKYGVVAAWFFSSLFFGVMHVYPAQVVGAFAIGLVLGFIYIATESLWAPIVLHAANNAVAYALMAAGYADADFSDLIPNRTVYVLVFITALVLTVVSGYMVRRTLLRLKASEKNPAEA